MAGTLTIQIKPTPTGSAIRFDYTVGGYMRFKVADVAPGVDRVLGEQLVGLARALGGSLPVAKDGTRARARRRPRRTNRNLDAAVADLVKDAPKEAPRAIRRRLAAQLASAAKGPACSSLSTPFSARMRSASG